MDLALGGVAIEQLDRIAEAGVELGVLGQVGHLPGSGGEGELAGALDRGVDPVAVEAGQQRLEVVEPELVQPLDLVGEVRHAVGQAVGQRGGQEPAVATRGADGDAAGLEHHHVAAGVVLLGLDGGPQPGEPAPTITRSASAVPPRGSTGSGRPGWSSQ